MNADKEKTIREIVNKFMKIDVDESLINDIKTALNSKPIMPNIHNRIRRAFTDYYGDPPSTQSEREWLNAVINELAALLPETPKTMTATEEFADGDPKAYKKIHPETPHTKTLKDGSGIVSTGPALESDFEPETPVTDTGGLVENPYTSDLEEAQDYCCYCEDDGNKDMQKAAVRIAREIAREIACKKQGFNEGAAKQKAADDKRIASEKEMSLKAGIEAGKRQVAEAVKARDKEWLKFVTTHKGLSDNTSKTHPLGLATHYNVYPGELREHLEALEARIADTPDGSHRDLEK